MNILFITLADYKTVKQRSIYTDLLRAFISHGHNMYAVSPLEKRKGMDTYVETENGCTTLRVRTGNIQKTNLIEKGISTVRLGKVLKRAVRKYFRDIKFDLVLYATPPITVGPVVNFIRKRDLAKTYLMLKDIFPQNAVDLGMFGKKSPIYMYFRSREKFLYKISDFIGCTTPGNISYILDNNPYILPQKVGICANCIEPYDLAVTHEHIPKIRRKYGLPEDKIILIYGGNIGKPQGTRYIADCLSKSEGLEEVYTVVVGAGTEYAYLDSYIKENRLSRCKLMDFLPKEEFDRLVAACDVGLIFLSHRSTTPITSSRLLSYTNAGVPILAATDPCTDVGKIICEGGFGWWCESNSTDKYCNCVREIIIHRDDLKQMGLSGRKYMEDNYTAEQAYQSIISGLSTLC